MRGDARAGLAVLVAVAVIAGVIWYRIGVAGSDAPPRRLGPAATAPAGSDAKGDVSTTTTRGEIVVVHVAGAVATPGVVELEPGARVIDAVEAAGGADDDADLDRLNLAARVADGERVLVQRVGDPPDPTAAPDEEATTGAGAADGLVDLNTATSAELEELPGIGPALAAAIIAERERRGRFRNVQELREVRGIGEKRFADLEGLVTV